MLSWKLNAARSYCNALLVGFKIKQVYNAKFVWVLPINLDASSKLFSNLVYLYAILARKIMPLHTTMPHNPI